MPSLGFTARVARNLSIRCLRSCVERALTGRARWTWKRHHAGQAGMRYCVMRTPAPQAINTFHLHVSHMFLAARQSPRHFLYPTLSLLYHSRGQVPHGAMCDRQHRLHMSSSDSDATDPHQPRVDPISFMRVIPNVSLFTRHSAVSNFFRCTSSTSLGDISLYETYYATTARPMS